MHILAAPATFAHEIDHNRFIAYLVPYAELQALLQRLKAEHPNASHFVTVYRYLNDRCQVVEGGHSEGSAETPSLAVLTGSKLIDVAVVTVCYADEKALQTEGWTSAYTKAVSGALSRASLRDYVKNEDETFSCEYRDVPRIEYLMHGYDITEIERKYRTFGVQWKVSGSGVAMDRFFYAAGRLIKRTPGSI
jgi:putative IMPACT (imprinted ancient) family translation regulator